MHMQMYTVAVASLPAEVPSFSVALKVIIPKWP